MHNDFFRIYNDTTNVAETSSSFRACDHADSVAFHGGKPRIVCVTKNGESSTNLPIDPNAHTCTKRCKNR